MSVTPVKRKQAISQMMQLTFVCDRWYGVFCEGVSEFGVRSSVNFKSLGLANEVCNKRGLQQDLTDATEHGGQIWSKGQARQGCEPSLWLRCSATLGRGSKTASSSCIVSAICRCWHLNRCWENGQTSLNRWDTAVSNN